MQLERATNHSKSNGWQAPILGITGFGHYLGSGCVSPENRKDDETVFKMM